MKTLFSTLLILAIGTGCGKKQDDPAHYTLAVMQGSGDVIAHCTGGDIPPSNPAPALRSGSPGGIGLWVATAPPKPHVNHCELVGKHTVDDLMNFILEYNGGAH